MYKLEGHVVTVAPEGLKNMLQELPVAFRQARGYYEHLQTSVGLYTPYTCSTSDTLYTADYMLNGQRLQRTSA